MGTRKYDVFGSVRSGSGGTTEYLFAGEQDDATLGYTYLRARYYDPAIGRFVSKDTHPAKAKAPETINRYAYVGNNPVNGTDPSGKFCWDCVFDFFSWIEDIQNVEEDINDALAGDSQGAGDAAADAGFLLADSLGLAIPALPSLGTVARHGDDVAKAIPYADGAKAKVGDILETAGAWLGDRYREIGDGVFRSADNERQFRMNDSCLCGNNPHVHFETVQPDSRSLNPPSHVYFDD